jgi:hypothetical protein
MKRRLLICHLTLAIRISQVHASNVSSEHISSKFRFETIRLAEINSQSTQRLWYARMLSSKATLLLAQVLLLKSLVEPAFMAGMGQGLLYIPRRLFLPSRVPS